MSVLAKLLPAKSSTVYVTLYSPIAFFIEAYSTSIESIPALSSHDSIIFKNHSLLSESTVDTLISILS